MDLYDADSLNNSSDDESQSLEGDDTSTHVPNPEGRNQHQHCREQRHLNLLHFIDLYIVTAPKSDQFIQQIITQYHRDNITDRKKISRLLKAEHGITMR